MTPAEVMARCRAAGVELTPHGGKLRLRSPAGAVTPDLKADLVRHKAAIIDILLSVCPTCGGGLDDKGRCWPCHDRRCAGCGRLTGSAFIQNCNACGKKLPDEPPWL